MFRLIFQNKVVGVSKLESGDPSIGCASGELIEAGSCAEIGKWILDENGVEEDGVYLLGIDERFMVVLGAHTPVPYAEGSII